MSPEELYSTPKETLAHRLVVTEVKGEICVTMYHGADPVGKIYLSPRRAYLHAAAILLSANLLTEREDKNARP